VIFGIIFGSVLNRALTSETFFETLEHLLSHCLALAVSVVPSFSSLRHASKGRQADSKIQDGEIRWDSPHQVE